MKNRKQGSSIALVMIVATAMGLVAYATMRLVDGETKRNKKAFVYHEARLAAESLLQSGFAELYGRYSRDATGVERSLPADALAPAKSPLEIPAEFVSEHSNGGAMRNLVVPQKRKYTLKSDIGSQQTELVGGTIGQGEWRFIDPRVPGNEFDQLAGMRAYVQHIELLSKATVDNPVWGRSTARVRQILEIRDAPLFAYAIFYHVPMEIAPGPPMDVYGKVHSNGDMWVQAGAGLNFHNKVTAAGDIFYNRQADDLYSRGSGPVSFTNGEGSLVSMEEDSTWESDARDAFGGGFLDSAASAWTELAIQLWDGNVQSGEHDVTTQTPIGVADYVEDTNPGTARKESFNSGYPIIQPPLDSSSLAIPDKAADPVGYRTAKDLEAAEKQKFSYKAGLTVKVSDSGSLSYFTYDRNADGSLKYDGSGDPVTIELQPSAAVANSELFSSTGSGNSEVVTSGLHDARQAKDLNVVEFDVSVLKDLVHGEAAGGGQAGAGQNEQDWGGKSTQKPANWWNGVVYVQFPQQSAASSRPDNVNPAIDGWGLKVVNGATIPNPQFAIDRDNYGMTIATNQQMYVLGDFNSDGSMATGSATQPDDNGRFAQEDEEAPAALAADAITFLSNNWDDQLSTRTYDQRVATDTEISAAILTGLVPTGDKGVASWSGGVENFPRFLEDWGGIDLRMRGSTVALFESEIATASWGSSYYSPPNRIWGFHEKFEDGFLPPGTPMTRTFRARGYDELSASEYAAYVTRLKSAFQ